MSRPAQGAGSTRGLWIKYPPLDAAVVDPGTPRRFLRSAGWKKVRDDFFHGQLGGAREAEQKASFLHVKVFFGNACEISGVR